MDNYLRAARLAQLQGLNTAGLGYLGGIYGEHPQQMSINAMRDYSNGLSESNAVYLKNLNQSKDKTIIEQLQEETDKWLNDVDI